MGQLESNSPKASYLLSSTIHLLKWVHDCKSQGSLDRDRVLMAELWIHFHRLFPLHHKLFGDSLHIGYFTNGVTDLPKTIGLIATQMVGVGRGVHVSHDQEEAPLCHSNSASYTSHVFLKQSLAGKFLISDPIFLGSVPPFPVQAQL